MSPPGRPGQRPGPRSGQTKLARVRVTNPWMGTAARPPARSPTSEIDEQTGLGEVYMRSLIRAQLRLAITLIAVIALTLGTLPLVFLWQPQLSATRVLGLPLAWLVIGGLLYPALLAGGWWLERAANRTERDFAEIVTRSRTTR